MLRPISAFSFRRLQGLQVDVLPRLLRPAPVSIHSLVMGNQRKRARAHGPPSGMAGPPGLQTAAAEAAPEPVQEAKFTDVKFRSLPLLPETLRALDKMGYTNCTTIQAASLPVNLSGVDVLCKAKTGTGKTLAFLIPAIEQLIKSNSKASKSISILVISPTRELAQQIEKEAQELARAHKLTTQSVVGGTNVRTDINRLNSNLPHILVGTPGRLIDLLEGNGLAQHVRGLSTFVLDEADRLLDMGFRPSIDRILRSLPPSNSRQTVMFSATYPENIQRLCKDVLKPNYEVVDTVGETTVQTAEKVDQSLVVTSNPQLLADLAHVLKSHQEKQPNFKAIVFFTTARLTGFYAEVFLAMGFPVSEMHSRKSQSHRKKVAEQFRTANRTIMFSSDVSARGVDYPDVSLVVQVGMPSDRDQYIHRVGRTGRAGKGGEAVLLLSDFEKPFIKKIRDLPVKERSAAPPQTAAQLQREIEKAVQRQDISSKRQAYQAWLGYYNTYRKFLGWEPTKLVAEANTFALQSLGCTEVPGIEKKTIGKMGLKGVPGLNEQGATTKPPNRQPNFGMRGQNPQVPQRRSRDEFQGQTGRGQNSSMTQKPRKDNISGQRQQGLKRQMHSQGGPARGTFDAVDW